MTHCHKAVLALLLSAGGLELQAQTVDPDSMSRAGLFIDAQAGRSLRRQGTNQQMAAIGLGYRWGMGQVTLLGFEVNAGEDEARFGSVGLNARFNAMFNTDQHRGNTAAAGLEVRF